MPCTVKALFLCSNACLMLFPFTGGVHVLFLSGNARLMLCARSGSINLLFLCSNACLVFFPFPGHIHGFLLACNAVAVCTALIQFGFSACNTCFVACTVKHFLLARHALLVLGTLVRLCSALRPNDGIPAPSGLCIGSPAGRPLAVLVGRVFLCRVKVAVNVLSAPVAHQLAGIVPVVVPLGTFLAVCKVFPVIHFEKTPPFLFLCFSGHQQLSFAAGCFYPRFRAILALTAFRCEEGKILWKTTKRLKSRLCLQKTR